MKQTTARTKGKHTILVTGGAGFLGRALVHELLKPGCPLSPKEIRLMDLHPAGTPTRKGVTEIKGDVRSMDDLTAACRGIDVVFHCAAMIDWGRHPEDKLYEANVQGTRNVIAACAAAGVRALVFTSTMDVLYDGRPLRDGHEDLPYPVRFPIAYAATKALAEREVLAANGTATKRGRGSVLRTCSLRPCGLFGEGDPYHISTLVRASRSGKLLFRIGSGRACFQHSYVGNVAHAHVLAAVSLLAPAGRAAGQAYVITDYPAKNFFEFLAPVLEGIGHPLPPRWRFIPSKVMMGVAIMAELGAFLARPFVRLAPTMNRTSVAMVCEDFTFSTDKALRDFDYRPIYTEEEAIRRTVAWFREHGPVEQREY